MAWMNEAMLCATAYRLLSYIHDSSPDSNRKFGYMNHAMGLQCITNFYYHINCPFRGNKTIIYKRKQSVSKG